MSLFDFLVASPNSAFAIAGTIVLLILLFELVGLLAGLSPGGFLDDLLPDGPDGEGGAGLLAGALAWLNAGRLPFLIFLLLLLAGFAVSGYLLQALARGATGNLVDGWIMALPAAVAGGLAARAGSLALGRVLSTNQTSAISTESLVGQTARVTIGPVSRTTPGRASVTDSHGSLHNLRVKAARAGDSFPVGTEVLLAAREKGLFVVVQPPAAMAAQSDLPAGSS